MGALAGCAGATAAGSSGAATSAVARAVPAGGLPTATPVAPVATAPTGGSTGTTSTGAAAAPSTPGTPAAPVAPGRATASPTTGSGLVLRGPQPLPPEKVITPTRLQIPAIGVDSGLERLTTVRGVLQPPTDPLVAGWWTGGPVPGSPGPAVIAGHLDSYTGPAVFIHLLDLSAGDRIYVSRSDGTRAVFVVDAVQTYEKSDFPTRAVYGTTPGSALRLITCGGTFDRQKQLYLANVVVYASLQS